MFKLLFALSLLALPATMSSQSVPLACEGRRATIRVSEIKAGGTVQGFLDAVKAHKAWFVSHGMPGEEIYAAPVMVRDEKTHAQAYSDKQFLTFHIYSTAGPAPKHDDAYDAFVKLYRENSDIKSEYNVCLPK